MRRSIPMVLFRVAVGLFCIAEGILRILHAEAPTTVQLVTGFPLQQYLSPIVGGIEMFGGAAMMVSLFAGDAALLLLVAVGTTLVATKLPILTGAAIGPFPPPKLPPYGAEVFLHEAWVELTILAGSLIVLMTYGLSFLKSKRKY